MAGNPLADHSVNGSLPEYWGWQNSIMTKGEEATRGGHVIRWREENALHH